MKTYKFLFTVVLIALSACGGLDAPVPTVVVPTVPPTRTPPPTLAPTVTPTVAPTNTPAPTFAVPTAAGRTTSGAASGTVARYDSSWEKIRGTTFDLGFDTRANVVTLTLKQPGMWLNATQGGAVYRNTGGNFKITAIVKASKSTNPSEPPSNRVHMGGLIARSPAGTTENYVHIVVGNAETGLVVETKNTTNNVSKSEAPKWPNAQAELRLCRVGSDFTLYNRAVNTTTWTLAATYSRSDLPPSLQVGASIYSAATPDLRVTYENMRIEEVKDKAECEK